MKLSEKLRNTQWNDDKYAMMELRHWFELCDEVAQLEAENQRLRELITRSCYYTVEPTEGNLAIFAAVHLLAWNERTEPKVLFDECSDEWIADALKEGG